MVVVIEAQEDPGDLVQSLEASTTCTVTSVDAKCLWMPATTLSIIWGSILTQLLLPMLMKFSELQC
jgi:hypothetical protein